MLQTSVDPDSHSQVKSADPDPILEISYPDPKDYQTYSKFSGVDPDSHFIPNRKHLRGKNAEHILKEFRSRWIRIHNSARPPQKPDCTQSLKYES